MMKLLAPYLKTAILKMAVVTKHGIRDLQRLVAIVSLLRAREAGKLRRLKIKIIMAACPCLWSRG